MSDQSIETTSEIHLKSRKKQVIIGILILIPLLLFTVWWTAAFLGESEIQARLTEYRAGGQPVELIDFKPPDIPDEENATIVLRQARDALILDDEMWEFVRDENFDELRERMDEFAKAISDNQEAFALVRKAQGLPDAAWDIDYEGSALSFLLPDLGSQRDLVRFLSMAGLFNHHQRNDFEAVELLRDSLSAATAARKCPSIIAQHVATAQEGLAVSAIEEMSHKLAISSDERGNTTDGPATKQQIRALITELLDMNDVRQQMQRSFYMERTFQYYCTGVITGKIEDPELTAEDLVITPIRGKPAAALFNWDLVYMLDFSTQFAEAGNQDNYLAAKDKLLPSPTIDGWWDSLSHSLSSILLPSFDRVIIRDYRGRAERVMAATALAIRLCEIDHGKRPEKLTDLVPDYLEKVPDDPFAAAGTPIGYLPDAPRPLLYSIGENGIDQHGQYAADPNDSPYAADYDMPFFLNGDNPADNRTDD